MTRSYALAAVGATALLLGGIATAIVMADSSADRFAMCRATQIVGGETIGGPFELVAETGETVTEADVIDRPALLYFGYTFCPDVCPLDTVRNAEAVDILAEDGHDVRPVFISIDPARDTPEVLAAFTDNIHPDLLGLTGSEAQVDAASEAYRTFYRRGDPSDPYYLVDHTTFSYLTLPEHGFVEFFRRDLAPAELAERAACFLDAA